MTVNFYGDQYKWFEGVVEDRDDPLKMGRVRVRIFGLHTEQTQHIPTALLPWATVMMPVSSASLNGIGRSPTGIVEGTRVVGFFRDGHSGQDPLIIGTLPGVSKSPKYQTRSNKVTTKGDRKAVYNNGVNPDTGQLVEPLKQLSLNPNLDINLLIVHCAATKPSMDIGAKEIDSWHRQKGWKKIGYHLVIRRNGVVEKGREIGETGAHAQGYNRKSVGVCMVGGIDEKGRPDDNFTHAQWEQLKNIVGHFINQYQGIKVIGHNEVANKACPSFNVQTWLAKVFPNGQVNPNELKDLGDGGAVAEGKKPLEETDDANRDASPTEGFAKDVASGSATVNTNYTENTYGFGDPNGVYPREDHIDESDTNRLGRNDSSDINKTIVGSKTANVVKDIPTAIDGDTWSEPPTPYNAQYPFNHVTETESGHVVEYDDTPGKERIHTYHKSGTFEEIHPDGTTVTKIVKDNYTIIAGDDFVLVQGTVNITVNGNATLNVAGNVDGKVGGNFDLGVKGTVNINSEGNMNLSTDGHMFLKTGGNIYEN